METTQNVELRLITEADIEGFRSAVDAVAKERLYLSRTNGPSLEGAQHFVQSNIAQRHPQFVAVAAGTVVGWCDIVRSTGDYEGHVGSMGMGLLAGWRDRGLGRRLLAAALESASQVGLTRVELSVHASNIRAIALYQKLGFEEEGRLRRARLIDGRFEDVVLMARLDPFNPPR